MLSLPIDEIFLHVDVRRCFKSKRKDLGKLREVEAMYFFH